jgi:cell division protein FtsB
MRLEALNASGALVELAEEIAARGAAVLLTQQKLQKEAEAHKETQEKLTAAEKALATATARVAELEQELKRLKDDATLEVVVTDMAEARASKAKKAE